MTTSVLDIPHNEIADFCQRWQIVELSLFGSALRDDFHTDSDVDVLVTFAEDVRWTLFDHVTMQDELRDLFGRKVDLVSRSGIENSQNTLRKRAILDTAQTVYAQS